MRRFTEMFVNIQPRCEIIRVEPRVHTGRRPPSHVRGRDSMIGCSPKGRGRAVVAFYGVRGIGSIYYLAYGLEQVELAEVGRLWAIVGFTIALSALIHGLTAGAAVALATGDGEETSE